VTCKNLLSVSFSEPVWAMLYYQRPVPPLGLLRLAKDLGPVRVLAENDLWYWSGARDAFIRAQEMVQAQRGAFRIETPDLPTFAWREAAATTCLIHFLSHEAPPPPRRWAITAAPCEWLVATGRVIRVPCKGPGCMVLDPEASCPPTQRSWPGLVPSRRSWVHSMLTMLKGRRDALCRVLGREVTLAEAQPLLARMGSLHRMIQTCGLSPDLVMDALNRHGILHTTFEEPVM
jgi:hypothetical protein